MRDRVQVLNVLSAAMQYLPGYALLKDIDSRYLDGNQRTAQLFGFSSHDQLCDISDYDINCAAAQSADLFVAQDHQLLKQVQDLSIIDMRPYVDGEPKSLLINKSLAVDDCGQAIAIVCQCSEINYKLLHEVVWRLALSTTQFTDHHQVKQAVNFYLCERFDGLGLSVRQSECLFYLIRGKTMREIGLILHISPRTVETHIDQIKHQLGCHTRSMLVEKVVNLGYAQFLPKSIINERLALL